VKTVPEAKNQTAAKPRGRRTAKAAGTTDTTTDKTTDTTTGKTTGTAAATRAGAEKPAQSAKAAQPSSSKSAQSSQPAQPAPKADETGHRLIVTIPLDGALVGTAVKAATLPLTAAKKVAQNKNGLPAYAAVGGLAVLGAVEWPVAAVGGLSLAALRRWGPLKPAPDQEPAKSA
jgi:hypothetical protein